MMWNSTQYVDSLVGDDGIHEFVARGGDAVEAQGVEVDGELWFGWNERWP